MSKCSYNCSEDRQPKPIPPYADISGIGVVIGYTATAGIAVLIITGYYFLGHRPELDPFRNDNANTQTPVLFKPNPVDKLILGYVRKPSDTKETEPSERRARLENALLKCILTMSDLQILTGLSILISGYFQLPCGFSVYHWQILVYLAWFCSLTHLSCLTFLRNYLYNHPGERLWRLLAMGALVTMLIVALLPTGNFGANIDPADYAICSFKRLAPIHQNGTGDAHASLYDSVTLNYASMIISILLMALGFLSRVVRLHRNLSVAIVTASRNYFSERARKILQKWYEKCEESSNQTSLWRIYFRRLFYYRPALAVFLTIRAILDLWSSMVLEVWWLIASFAWGIHNLALSLDGYKKKAPSNKDWTFGQIVPVILLAAPVLSVIEFFVEKPSNRHQEPQTNNNTNECPAPSRTETMELATNATSSPPNTINDNPDHDFYNETWFHLLVFYLLCGVIVTTILVLFVPFSGPQDSKLSKGKSLIYFQPTPVLINWVPIVFPLSAINVILFSLLEENLEWKSIPKRVVFWVVSFSTYFVMSHFLEIGYLMGFLTLGAMYFVLSVVYYKRTATSS